jgi:hypothetical protein
MENNYILLTYFTKDFNYVSKILCHICTYMETLELMFFIIIVLKFIGH